MTQGSGIRDSDCKICLGVSVNLDGVGEEAEGLVASKAVDRNLLHAKHHRRLRYVFLHHRADLRMESFITLAEGLSHVIPPHKGLSIMHCMEA